MKNVDVFCCTQDGLPILYRAIHMKNEPVALALINGGANVNLRNSERYFK
jgi:hypothetical protein